MRKKLCCLAICLLLTFIYAVPVSGSDILDGDKECSVTMELKTKDQEALTNVMFEFYQVGEIASYNQEKITYQYLETFRNSNITLNVEEASENEKSAKELCAYAKQQNIQGKRYVTDAEGIVRITGLKPGLYLVGAVYQEREVGKVEYTKPFLAGIPEYENNELIFDVTIKAKVSKETLPLIPLEKPVNKGKKPGIVKLPQTGMLRWPIPVLALAGILLLEAGWYEGYVKKNE